MTREELNAATSRLFNISRDIFDKLAQKDSRITNEEKNVLEGDFTADPFNVHVKLTIYPENGLLSFFSLLPFDVPPAKSNEVAKLACTINYNDLYAGNYDYSVEQGKILFRLSIPFRNSILSKDLIEECLQYTISTVSKYNNKIFETIRE
ncbi:MAG: YbjN domain-containing protein [Lachnospiraceae bacterium]|nr:YbjN domain-containing protein [Lachnospiraceae bacterium]